MSKKHNQPHVQSTGISPETQNFSARLSWILKKRQVKASVAAKAAGVHSSYVSMLLSGKKENPSAEIVLRIADFLKCDAKWLLQGLGNPNLIGEFTGELPVFEEEAKIKAILAGGPAAVAAKMETKELRCRISGLIEEIVKKSQNPYMKEAAVMTLATLIDEAFSRIGTTVTQDS